MAFGIPDSLHLLSIRLCASPAVCCCPHPLIPSVPVADALISLSGLIFLSCNTIQKGQSHVRVRGSNISKRKPRILTRANQKLICPH
ncbi:hypothetical protein OG21DRAFT_1514814, partial [Imleria badia]